MSILQDRATRLPGCLAQFFAEPHEVFDRTQQIQLPLSSEALVQILDALVQFVQIVGDFRVGRVPLYGQRPVSLTRRSIML